jgi:hypothetical protein
VKERLHPGLQVQAHNGLGDPVRDRRHPEHPRAAVPLRYLHRAHRRGHVAPRRESIPELVEVSLKVPLELLDRLLVDAGRALVGLDPPIGLPDGPLGDLKRLRLRLAHPAPPTRRRLTAEPARTTRPLRFSPITGPSPLLRDGPPLCPAPVPSPSQFPLLGDLPCATDRRPRLRHWPSRPVGATGSHVPCKSLNQARATSTPDAIWAVNRLPPDPSRGSKASPVSTSPLSFDTSSVVRFRSPSWLTPAALTARRFPRRSPPRFLTAAARGGLRPPPAQRPRRATRPTTPGSSISCTAPHPDLAFYIQPPSTFVAHPRTTFETLAAWCAPMVQDLRKSSQARGCRRSAETPAQ